MDRISHHQEDEIWVRRACEPPHRRRSYFAMLGAVLATAVTAMVLASPAAFAAGPSADLSVTKTHSPEPASPGATITYTIIVRNGGPDAAQNVALRDPLPLNTTFSSLTAPAGWTCTTTGTVTCTIGTLAGGSASQIFTLKVVVDAGAAATDAVLNTASVASSTFDPSLGNNCVTDQTTLNAATAVEIPWFAVRTSSDGVRLSWRTAGGSRIAGFNVYRDSNGRSARLNRALIRVALGGTARGHAYSLVDHGAQARVRALVYRLQVVHLDGSVSWLRARLAR